MKLKLIENIVAKGEIARSEQFLLLSQCFQKPFAAEASESVCMWEKVNIILNSNKYPPTHKRLYCY